jgi:hypothetical protein
MTTHGWCPKPKPIATLTTVNKDSGQSINLFTLIPPSHSYRRASVDKAVSGNDRWARKLQHCYSFRVLHRGRLTATLFASAESQSSPAAHPLPTFTHLLTLTGPTTIDIIHSRQTWTSRACPARRGIRSRLASSSRRTILSALVTMVCACCRSLRRASSLLTCFYRRQHTGERENTYLSPMELHAESGN